MVWIIVILLVMFALYLYAQTKVKNHTNYPVVYAMSLGFMAYMSSSALPQWLIENINKHTSFELTAYEPLTMYEMWGIWIFLASLVFLFYRKNFTKSSPFWIFLIILAIFSYRDTVSQANSFWAIFNFGTITNHQENSNSATKEDTEEIKRKLDVLLQQRSSPALSKAEKEKLEKEILRLRRELIAHTIDDKGVQKAQKIMHSTQEDRVDKALQAIEEYNSKEQIETLKQQQIKQSKILQYKATLYEEKKDWGKAKESYKEVLKFDDSYDNNFNYAYFLQTKSPQDRKEIAKYCQITLAKCSSDSQKAAILNNLANYYADDNTKRKETEEYYKEAHDTYRALAKENKAVYLPYVAITLNNLALFYSKDNTKRKEVEDKYKEALDIRRGLAKTNKAVYARDYANTLVMGVALFSAPKRQLDEALKLLRPYPDSYGNVGFLRKMITKLQ